MTVIEFSRFLSLYKRVNQIVEKIYNSKHGNEENNKFQSVAVINKRIVLVYNCGHETILEDITDDFSKEIIFEDIVF